MAGVLRGDLGNLGRVPLLDALIMFLPNTLILAFGGIVVATVFGIVLGIIAAIKQNKLADNIIMGLSLLTSSIPVFFLAVLLMLIFSLHLGWLPSRGMAGWQGMILPIATLGLPSIGFIARTTRTAMLDIRGAEYIKAARARGISERNIIFNHTLKNMSVPIITAVALRLSELLAGTFLVELAFSVPGVGRVLLDAITNRSPAPMIGGILALWLSFTLINLAADLLCAAVDPKTSKGILD